MSHEAFMRFCEEKILRGERMLAALMRTLIERDEPELYEHIESFDDAVHGAAPLRSLRRRVEPVAMLPQLLFGALPHDATRRARSADRRRGPPVPSCDWPLPHLAPAKRDGPGVDRARDEYLLRDEQEKPVTYRFEPLLLVEGTLSSCAVP